MGSMKEMVGKEPKKAWGGDKALHEFENVDWSYSLK